MAVNGVIRSGDFAGVLTLKPDVAVIGSGPGGALAAARLAAAGLDTVVLEEGSWYEPHDLAMTEARAYRHLYQDSGSRATDDLGMVILQGRSAGGGSTVNWMTSLRAAESTLEFWRERRAVHGLDYAELSRHWDAIERRLNVHTARLDDVNRNNQILRDGAARLGIPTTLLPRNTHECTNLGLCSVGCPIDAKRTAQQTYLRDALQSGARIYTEARVTSLKRERGAIRTIEASVLDPETLEPNGATIIVEPRTVFLAAGAINSPLLLLRSGLGTAPTGKRTWLHPVVAMVASFDDPVEAWYGSPQSVACQSFERRDPAMGYFLEAPPLLPVLASLAAPWFSDEHASLMKDLRHTSALIGLMIDGFGDGEEGGTVTAGKGGRLRLTYDFTARLREAANEAMKTMARIQLAAGARRVRTLHSRALEMTGPDQLEAIEQADFGPGRLSLFTAHQMGGCAMGEMRHRSVVNSEGRHHQIANLYVCDGSVFPTGAGVNPMLTIYAISSWITERFLARQLNH